MARLAGIEASRGVAAGLVVLYHASRHLDQVYGLPALRALFQFGHAGVDFFFVISGFIILHVHFGDIGDASRLTRYLGRRFTRLVPTYWLALGVMVLLDSAGRAGPPEMSALLWSATLLPSDSDMVLGVAWTLRYEVFFYAIFALLIVNRTAGLIGMAMWAALIGMGTLFPGWNGGLPAQFNGSFNVEFFLGMAVALRLRRVEFKKPKLALGLGISLFCIAAALEDTGALNGYGGVARLAYGFPSALIVAGLAAADRQGGVQVPAVLRASGLASYSIYLFHLMFIGIAWKILTVTHIDQVIPPLAGFVILASAAILGGVVTSRHVEYPLMRFVRNLTRR